MAADYKDKIRKLLALAESPEEAEAKAALLKARELMAEHKLCEADLEEPKNQRVKKVQTSYSCSKRREPWLVGLSAVIGANYCCQAFRRRFDGQQTQYIGFVGLENDVEVCVEIFKYAADYIRTTIKRIKKENRGMSSVYITKLCNSYGYGFAKGVRSAFEAQQEEYRDGWGLVLVMPKEVTEACEGLKKREFRAATQNEILPKSYAQGYEEGKAFAPSKALGGTEV